MTSPTRRDQDKPTVKKSKVVDLDAMEREGKVPPPFAFKLQDVKTGKSAEFVVSDLEDLDWKLVLNLRRDDLEQFFAAVLGDDYGRFSELTIPLWKVNHLGKLLDEHFGWTEKAGELGEDTASPTS